MIDRIIDYANGCAVWMSDLYPYETFIGYEKNGNVYLNANYK